MLCESRCDVGGRLLRAWGTSLTTAEIGAGEALNMSLCRPKIKPLGDLDPLW
jgi:hypothetical protein